MPPLDRRLARFCIVAAAIVAICLVPYPGLGHAFTSAFAAICNTIPVRICTTALDCFDIDFHATSGTNRVSTADTFWYVALWSHDLLRLNSRAIYIYDVRRMAYVPITVFVALTLAAPLRITRSWVKASLLGLSFVLMLVFLAAAAHFALSLGLMNDTVKRTVNAFAWTVGSTAYVDAALLWAFARWTISPSERWFWLDCAGTLPERAKEA